MITGLAGAGCRYVHIDAPGYTAYVDGPSLDAIAGPRRKIRRPSFRRSLKGRQTDLDFEVFGGRDLRDSTCAVETQRSMWHREGAYDAIAEMLFNQLNHDRFLLEYDHAARRQLRTALRFRAQGKKPWLLGLVSTKVPQNSSRFDDLEAANRRGQPATFALQQNWR